MDERVKYYSECPLCGMPLATYESQAYADELIQLHVDTKHGEE